MTVARQICAFEYGVSLACKRELKRTLTKTGVSDGVKIHANVNTVKRKFRNALYSAQKQKSNWLLAFCKVRSSTSTAQYERRAHWKAPESQNSENVIAW